MLQVLGSLSWISHYTLTGRRCSWCAWAWTHREESFWADWILWADAVFGAGHCEASARYWTEQGALFS